MGKWPITHKDHFPRYVLMLCHCLGVVLNAAICLTLINHPLLQWWLHLNCMRALAGDFVWAQCFLVQQISLFCSCLSWTTITTNCGPSFLREELHSNQVHFFLPFHNFTDLWFIIFIDLGGLSSISTYVLFCSAYLMSIAFTFQLDRAILLWLGTTKFSPFVCSFA